MTAATDTFDADWNTFNSGIAAHNAAIQQLEQDKAQYATLLAQFLAIRNNPEKALLYFLAIISASTKPNDSSNILGMLDDKMGILGKSLLVTAQTTQLTNDIQDITTNPDGSTVSLADACARLDKLLDAFNPNGPQQDPSLKQLNQHVQQAFDPSAIQAIFGQLQTIRNTVHLGNGDVYDPAQGSSSIDFDPNDPTKLNSFQEMQQDLSKKDDSKHATEAAKSLSDSLSILSSTTQGVNSALNEQVSQQTGFEKNVQSFVASLMKSEIDLYNSIVQNASK